MGAHAQRLSTNERDGARVGRRPPPLERLTNDLAPTAEASDKPELCGPVCYPNILHGDFRHDKAKGAGPEERSF